jgi:putative membrane protein
MTLRWLLAAAHLLAMALAFASVLERARAFRGPLDSVGLRRVFRADNAWGLSALIGISTGLGRAFGGFEKGSGYYVGNTTFWVKMGILGLILALEAWPMATLIRWRIAVARRTVVDTAAADTFATIGYLQAALLVLLVLAATAMARGIGY